MISIVSFSESRGGAAKATQKIFNALKKTNIDVQYVVVEKKSDGVSIIAPIKLQYFSHFIKRLVALLLQKLQVSPNLSKHSLNIFSCNVILDAIKDSQLVHLNWINNETVAIAKLPSITANIIITLHDEWFYCGSEHLALDSQRPFQGYNRANKNVRGFDWDSFIWNQKLKALSLIKDRLIFTVPSSWMLDRVKQSKLLSGHDIRLVPNVIDTDQFKRVDSSVLLQQLPISDKVRVIVFGAVYGKSMGLKGFSLLQKAFNLLAERITDRSDILLVSFGGKSHENRGDMGFKHIELGHIADTFHLAQLYSLATMTVVPSMVESFGQVAAESLACETPVVAFNSSGLKDIVLHQKSGYLAEPFSIAALADGLEWILSRDSKELLQLGICGRDHVINNFSEPVVMKKLLSIYEEHGVTT